MSKKYKPIIINVVLAVIIVSSILVGLQVKNKKHEQQKIKDEIKSVQYQISQEHIVFTNLEHNLFEDNKELDRVTTKKIELEEEFEETGNEELISLIDELNGVVGHLKGKIKEGNHQLIDSSSDKQSLHDRKRELEEGLE